MRDVSSLLGGNCLFKLPLGHISEDVLRSFIRKLLTASIQLEEMSNFL